MSNAGQAFLTIGGLAVGAAFGAPQLGYLIGAGLGTLFFPTQLPTQRGPTLDNLNVQVSTIGNPIPRLWGRFGVGGNVIWSSGLIPTTHKKTVGGKGGPEQTVETTTYSVDCAIAGPEGVMGGLRRMWADAICIYDKRPQQEGESTSDFNARLAATAAIDDIIAIYLGTEDQMPDPTIESYLGVGDTLAYRGLSYFVLTGFQLERFGNRIPNIVTEWYTIGEEAEEGCNDYSGGTLHPWYFLTHSGPYDPRDAQNGHLYGYMELGGTASHSFETAMADMNAASDGYANFICGQVPQEGDSIYIHGWSTSTTPNYIQPCESDPPTLDYVVIQMTLNRVYLANPDFCDDMDRGSATWTEWSAQWWAFLGGFGTVKHISNGHNTGAFVALPPGQTPEDYFEGVPSTSSDVNLVNGSIDHFDTPESGEFNVWSLRAHELGVRRWHDPGLGCLYGTPVAPGYCILNGQLVRTQNWVRVSGTFKHLRAYDTDGGNLVTSYPVGPTLHPDDTDYNNQAFWEAAYAAAVADPTIWPPIPDDWVYGVDYPTEAFSHATNLTANSPVWQLQCTGEIIDTPCVPVAEIVADICRLAGLTDDQFDVTDIDACVEGYVVNSPMSAREMIVPLMTFGLFDAVESQGVLKFVKRGHAHVATLTENDLAAHGAGSQRPTVVEVHRQLEELLPRTLRLKYASPERAYEQSEQKASRATVNSTNDVTIGLPIAMSDEAAAQLVEILLYNQWIGRTTYSGVTTRAQLALEPTDNILVPVDGFYERMRITETNFSTGGLYQLLMVRDDDGSYVSTAVPEVPAGSGTGGGAGGTIVCPIEVILLDIPGLRTQDTDAGYYAVARSLCDNWTCGELYRSPDGGETYTWVGKFDNEGTIGTVISADLDGSSPDTLVIQLESGGPLENATEDQLNVGVNLCAVGMDGRWLLCQYTSAVLDSSDIWTLQISRVGLFESMEHLGDVGEGDRFVLLADAAVVRINESPASIGVEKTFKAVACGEIIDNVPSFTFTTHGLSYVPAAPPTHVISCTLSTPPTNPSDGDCYLVPLDTGATGAWDGHEGEICCWSNVAGGWQCTAPPAGVPIFCNEDGGYVTPDQSGNFGDAPWQYPIEVFDEGVSLGVPGSMVQLDFVGTAVTAALDSSGRVTVTVNATSIAFFDEGVPVGGDVSGIDFVGDNVTATLDSSGLLTVAITGSAVLQIQEDGVDVGPASTLNFTGPVTVTADSSVVTVDVSAAGSTIPINTQTGNYTLVLGDAGYCIYRSGTNSGNTWTIPSNASVPYPVGTCLMFDNRDTAANTVIAITSDTLVYTPGGATGSRTLLPGGRFFAHKVETTVWHGSGTGVY